MQEDADGAFCVEHIIDPDLGVKLADEMELEIHAVF